MRKVVFMCAILAIAGCASRNAPVSHEMPTAEKDAFVEDFMRDKLRSNGPAVFCEQESYAACLGVTTEKCLAELSPSAEPCFDKAEDKYGDFVKTNSMNFISYYFQCMVFGHISMHSSDALEISGCLKESKLDQRRIMNSMLR